MRTGATQQSPTALEEVTVTIGGNVYKTTDETNLILSVKTDEQLLGGACTIEFDNSDADFDGVNWVGQSCTINFGFDAVSGSNLPPLWVNTQSLNSEEGKLTFTLEIIDGWSFLALCNTNAGAQYWNYPEQDAGGAHPDADHYDKTVAEIMVEVVDQSIGKVVTVDDDDGIINTYTPTFYVTNARNGLAMLQAYTQTYLVWKEDGELHAISPTDHDTVYSYDVANLFFNNVSDQTVVMPNKVIYWGRDTDNEWISGEATNAASYAATGFYVIRNYFWTDPNIKDVSTTVGALESLAEAAISRIEGEGNQGVIVAMMHCSQELLDKVSITDSRYATAKTTTGYVHRITREYNRGIYRVTLQLGGVAGGVEVPSAPPLPVTDIAVNPPDVEPAHLDTFMQNYGHNLTYSSTNYFTVRWVGPLGDGSGRIFFGNGDEAVIDNGQLIMYTGNAHYIYYERGNSTLQATQTFSSAIGKDKVLLATAKRAANSTNLAYVSSVHGDQSYINVDNICNNIVGTLQLAADAVTSAKIAADSIQGDVIAAGAITETKIGDNSIATAKLQAASIVAGKLATGSVIASKIQAGSVTSPKIQAGAVTADKITVDNLQAISAILGTLDSGTINALTAYCGGGAVTLDSNGIEISNGGKFQVIAANASAADLGGWGGDISGGSSHTINYQNVSLLPKGRLVSVLFRVQLNYAGDGNAATEIWAQCWGSDGQLCGQWAHSLKEWGGSLAYQYNTILFYTGPTSGGSTPHVQLYVKNTSGDTEPYTMAMTRLNVIY